MQTSYFGNISNIKNPLSISGKAPDWYKGAEFKKLAPKWSFFNDYKTGKIDERGYTEQYLELVLKPLNAAEIFNHIVKKYGEDVTLLCYEKPDEFCHRHIVAKWFSKSLGVKVEEASIIKL